MEQAIELMMAICFLLLGLSLLFRSGDWLDWMHFLQQRGTNSSIVLGMTNLLLGTFIIAFHWVWSGLAMIVTIFGCLFMFRALVLLMCPKFLPGMLKHVLEHHRSLIPFAGVFAAVVGLLLFYDLSALSALADMLQPGA